MRDVAFTCDDNGAKFLRVSVYSLLSHYRGSEPIRINILEGYGGHSAENLRALEDLIAKFPGTVVRYVNVEKAVEPYADLIMNRADSRWNIFTWTPIFGPDLLSDVTGNLIHFDIDLLFNADISPLFEMNLGDKLFAVAYEYHYAPGSRHNAVWDNGILPPSVERYFNTGVVVFNTQKCRAEQTAKQILDWYRAHYDIADRIEQDAYNALFWNRIVVLPIKWNLHDRQLKFFARGDLSAKYWFGNPPRECLEAALAPCILHFWGPKKPWKVSHRPYRKLYHAAMRAVGLTPPKEPLLAPWYNLTNALDKKRIARRLKKLSLTK